MEIISSVRHMQEKVLELKRQGKRIAFVPTMGALHEGHLRLVDVAKSKADLTVMSLFVNPTQFGPREDFAKYPRDPETDRKLAESRGVDILFTPEAGEIYPPGHQTFVVVTELTRGLCSASRPGHFRGVATVVAALFLIVQPDAAVFGEKDYQQLQIISRMAVDLHFPIEIVGVPTVREADGLAMSSRNRYLSPEDRKDAAFLHRALLRAQEIFQKGERKPAVLQAEAEKILREKPNLRLEYLEIVDAQSLQALERIERPARAMLAVHLHETRLIDNVPLIP
jgi:pantoate--beta-alanine ligase